MKEIDGKKHRMLNLNKEMPIFLISTTGALLLIFESKFLQELFIPFLFHEDGSAVAAVGRC